MSTNETSASVRIAPNVHTGISQMETVLKKEENFLVETTSKCVYLPKMMGRGSRGWPDVAAGKRRLSNEETTVWTMALANTLRLVPHRNLEITIDTK